MSNFVTTWQVAKKEAQKRSPTILNLVGLSDADGTRTRNLRIDSPDMQIKSDNEKPTLSIARNSCLSSGLSENCYSQIQTWIEACPVELSASEETELIAWLSLDHQRTRRP